MSGDPRLAGTPVSGTPRGGGPGRRPASFSGAGGVRLAGDAFGDPAGPPVVMLHGASQNRHAWSAVAEALATGGWYVVTVDLRGQGDSDWPRDGAYSLEAFGGDVVALTAASPSLPSWWGRPLAAWLG